MPNSASAETPGVSYEVVHTTHYAYSEAVSVSHHVARVMPRACPGQECLRHALQIEPEPAAIRTHQDYFGNAVTFFIVDRAHADLTVRATSTVRVQPRSLPAPGDTPPWEQARNYDTLPLEAVECLFDSASIAVSDAVAVYAHSSFPPGRPLLDAVADLIGRIHADFTFDPQATTVATRSGPRDRAAFTTTARVAIRLTRSQSPGCALPMASKSPITCCVMRQLSQLPRCNSKASRS
jgi:transglutaminase-like putative cysteine protease